MVYNTGTLGTLMLKIVSEVKFSQKMIRLSTSEGGWGADINYRTGIYRQYNKTIASSFCQMLSF